MDWSSTVCDSVPMIAMDDYNPRLLVLPGGLSPQTQICTLAHPRTSSPYRYLFDPEKGIYEFIKVAAPKPTGRSWLIGDRAKPPPSRIDTEETREAIPKEEYNVADGEAPPDAEHARDRAISDGYVIKDAELLIATPIDYLFLVLPCFTTPSGAKSPLSKRLFLSADDLLEKLSLTSRHFNQILSHASIRQAMEGRMQDLCDTVSAGDQKMYRLSDEKLLSELILKAENMIVRGLPNSMEEKFIREALETPISVLEREESFVSDAAASQNKTPFSETTSLESVESQASTTTSDSTASSTSAATEITVPGESTLSSVPTSLYYLLRLRTALTYIISSYIPACLSTTLQNLLSNAQSPIDFAPLDQHLANIAKLRAEALASRSLGDFSRKRSMYEEDDAAETRAEKKKQKNEEEEKRKKAGESRGIRDLKKVDIKGMKKMSDFFGKAAVKKH